MSPLWLRIFRAAAQPPPGAASVSPRVRTRPDLPQGCPLILAAPRDARRVVQPSQPALLNETDEDHARVVAWTAQFGGRIVTTDGRS